MMITSDLMKITVNQGSSCGDSSRVSRLIEETVSDLSNSSGDSGESICNWIVSPGGNKYHIPRCSSDLEKPLLKQEFDTLDGGIKFYKEYGRKGGFDIRMTTEIKDETGKIVVMKYVVCSNSGYNNKGGTSEESCTKVVRRRTMSKRCGCKAKCVFKLLSGTSRYFVSKFVEVHNHPLATEEGIQFLKSSREMNLVTRQFVVDAAKVNIGTSKAFTLMKEMVGGYENVGATVRDFRNFNRDLKCFVGERDGQMLIDKFKVLKETCDSFYYAYDIDVDGHLTKILWADAIGRRNYEIYGDAVSFDATFDTNRYNMIFAPFTGVDKHYKCVTFAACLLSKEDVIHFKWAFDQFLKAMGRNPVLMVTDQCPAMKVAIPEVFKENEGMPATKHRLCMWHLMENFPIKLGNQLCKETDFLEKMKKYIWSSNIDDVEFEAGWSAVVREFKLEGNKWLNKMYMLRKSWIPAFFRDEPMFGLMRTTSRSESENFFFSQFHKQGDTLCEFWLRFQSAMDKQRNEMRRLNHESNSGVPDTVSKWFIESDAGELFTRDIFYKLHDEIISGLLEMQIKRMSEEVNGVTDFEIRDVNVKGKIFKVRVSYEYAVCSCNKFVMCGIVCRHSFCAMKQIGVTKFPKSLVLNRWSKAAESGNSSLLAGVAEDHFKMQSIASMTTKLWFNFRQLVSKARRDINKLKRVNEVIQKLSDEMDDDGDDGVTMSKADHLSSIFGTQSNVEVSIKAPTMCKNKGSGLKRFISQREKAINNSKKRIRRCKKCSATTHDSRTCPKKKTDADVASTTSNVNVFGN